jgi:hypothetical protein
MKEDTKEDKLILLPYNSSNGIMICCKSCGCDMEETDNGYYDPIVYEREKYERKCFNCRNQ